MDIGAATRVLARLSFAIMTTVVTFCLAVALILHCFPGWLDGADAGPGQPPNYLRNFLEILSFAATTILAVVAVVGFVATIRLLREAERTRVADLFTALEARWASAEMIASREAFAKMMKRCFEKHSRGADTDKKSLPRRADAYLCALERADYANYVRILNLVDYLEYLGLMSDKRLIDIADLATLVGLPCLDIASLMSIHLDRLKNEAARQGGAWNLRKPPVPYVFFDALVDRLNKYYGAPSENVQP